MRKSHVEAIKNQIREDIKSGRLRESDALPPRSALVEQFNATYDTVEKALHALEIEGLIVKSRGRVLRVSPRRARVTTNDEVFRDVMAAMGYEVKVEHLKTPGIIPMSPSLAKLFRMPEGTPVIERMRREIVNGIVYRYSRKTYLAELVPAEHLEKRQADYTYNVRRVLEEARPLSRIEEIIIARAITETEEAHILNAAKGAPVLDQADGSSLVITNLVAFSGGRRARTEKYATAADRDNALAAARSQVEREQLGAKHTGVLVGCTESTQMETTRAIVA